MSAIKSSTMIGGKGENMRPLNDFYPTPKEVSEVMAFNFMVRTRWRDDDKACIWEPAAGDNAMAHVLANVA